VTEQVERSVLTLENLKNITSGDIAVAQSSLSARKISATSASSPTPYPREEQGKGQDPHRRQGTGDRLQRDLDRGLGSGRISTSASRWTSNRGLPAGESHQGGPRCQHRAGDQEHQRHPDHQLGSRNANTTLRLKDGETQVLAGLIADEDRTGASKMPLSTSLLGRLFSTSVMNSARPRSCC
jgi:general secretion pathway protein D